MSAPGLAHAARRALLRGVVVGATLAVALVGLILAISLRLGFPPSPFLAIAATLLTGGVLGLAVTTPLALVEHVASSRPESVRRDVRVFGIAWAIAYAAAFVGTLQVIYTLALVKDPGAFSAGTRAIGSFLKSARRDSEIFLGLFALLATPLALSVVARLRWRDLARQSSAVLAAASALDVVPLVVLSRKMTQRELWPMVAVAVAALVFAAVVPAALRLADRLEARLEERLRTAPEVSP